MRLAILEMAREGMIESTICRKLGINHQTLKNWKEQHPEFLATLKEAKRIVDDTVVDSLLMKARGFERNGTYYPPDATSMIFWLKNRQRKDWTDTQRREFTGKDGAAIQTEGGPIITVTLPANGYEAKEEDKK